MNQTATYISRHAIITFVLSMVVVGCQELTSEDKGFEVAIADSRLQPIEGILLFNGEPFTGRLVERYRDGVIRYSAEYRNGLLDGISESWYADGSRRERRLFDKGMKEGVHEGWWEDGSPRFVYEFRDDLHEGKAREWFENGQLYRDFSYVGGREEGPQVMYFEDGSVRASYRVIDGRRYGSIGTKPCRQED